MKSDADMEALISAFVDGELVQQEEQKVRIYLEDHPEAKRKMEEYLKMKGDIKKLKFDEPDPAEWEDFETPRGSGSWRVFWLCIIIPVETYFFIAGSGIQAGWYCRRYSICCNDDVIYISFLISFY